MNKLIYSYCFLIPFMNLLKLPMLGRKIQLTEIIFLLLVIQFLYLVGTQKIKVNYKMSALILSWPLSVSIATLINFNRSSILELFGSIYLSLLAIIISTLVLENRIKIQNILMSILLGGISAGTLGIIGWLLTQNEYPTSLAWDSSRDYPYLGKVGRAQGYTTNPNMLASYMVMCSFISWILFYKKIFSIKVNNLLQIFLSLVILLTLSKFIVPYIGAQMITTSIIFFKSKIINKLAYISFIALGIFYLLATHLLLLENSSETEKMLINEAYASIEPINQFDSKSLYITNYTINKQASFYAIQEHPFSGLGGGNFNAYVGKLKEINKYPSFFTNYDPHNTFLGVWAENGLIAWCVMLLFIVCIFRSIKIQKESVLRTLLYSYIAYLILEASVTDIMNFRQYWIIAAIFISTTIKNSQTLSLHYHLIKKNI